MQITAFKAILARRINIRGCEDYKNTFARKFSSQQTTSSTSIPVAHVSEATYRPLPGKLW